MALRYSLLLAFIGFLAGSMLALNGLSEEGHVLGADQIVIRCDHDYWALEAEVVDRQEDIATVKFTGQAEQQRPLVNSHVKVNTVHKEIKFRFGDARGGHLRVRRHRKEPGRSLWFGYLKTHEFDSERSIGRCYSR